MRRNTFGIGRERTEKIRHLFMLHKSAMHAGDSVLIKKALDDMKELGDKTGL